MEKFGLFDLIDKLNLSAKGKKEFANNPSDKNNDDANQTLKNGVNDPIIYPPQHYMMNEKMIVFCKKHEDFKQAIIKSSK